MKTGFLFMEKIFRQIRGIQNFVTDRQTSAQEAYTSTIASSLNANQQTPTVELFLLALPRRRKLFLKNAASLNVKRRVGSLTEQQFTLEMMETAQFHKHVAMDATQLKIMLFHVFFVQMMSIIRIAMKILLFHIQNRQKVLQCATTMVTF